MNDREREQLVLWLEQLIDDRLAPDAMAGLERLLMEDAEARNLYLDLTRQHAQLHLDRVRLKTVAADGSSERVAVRTGRRTGFWVMLGMAAAACLLAAVWLGQWATSTPSPPSLARLTSAEDASWGPSTLPTLVPDSTFSVYGLTDESLDAWAENDLRWESAPANVDAPGALDERLVRKLGEFHVPRGRQTGRVSIEGAPLRDFLNSDTNGMVTAIVVRDTPDSRSPGLVHAFANHKHPTAAAPALELKLSD